MRFKSEKTDGWDDFTAEPGAEYVYRFHPMQVTSQGRYGPSAWTLL